jgi:hypothetical protein
MIWLRRLYRRIEDVVLPVIDSPSVRRVAGLLLLGAVFSGLLVAVQRVPEWQTKRASVRSSAVNPEAKTTPADVAALQNEMRKTFIQVVGGLFAFVALVFTYRRVKVAEQGHITDRYTKAIEQLGALTADNKPNVEVRLGAIYALERIAFDSPRDHWPIMEVLTAYVRQNAPAPAQEPMKQETYAQDTPKENEDTEKKIVKTPATEIQAILTVLGRRKRGHKRERKGQRLHLGVSDLCGAFFMGAYLDGAIFIGAHLESVYFTDAHLDRANFIDANIDRANFDKAHLDGARFDKAHLDGAGFTRAHLDGAGFYEAHLDGARFLGAHLDEANFNQAQLNGARFELAYLAGAWFPGAHLREADFTEANLAGAFFHGALDLTVGQFASSLGVEQAHFDEAFRRELELAKIVPTKAAVGNDDAPHT